MAQPDTKVKDRQMLQVYFPQEWTDLQARLIKHHPPLWKHLQSLSKEEAIAYLNICLGTEVREDALLKDAGKVFMQALLRTEGTIVINSRGDLSK